jgi:hypothetical protein
MFCVLLPVALGAYGQGEEPLILLWNEEPWPAYLAFRPVPFRDQRHVFSYLILSSASPTLTLSFSEQWWLWVSLPNLLRLPGFYLFASFKEFSHLFIWGRRPLPSFCTCSFSGGFCPNLPPVLVTSDLGFCLFGACARSAGTGI